MKNPSYKRVLQIGTVNNHTLFTNSDPERHLHPSRLIRVKLFALLKIRRGQVLWESRLNSSQDGLSSHHHNDLDVQISYELFREFEQI